MRTVKLKVVLVSLIASLGMGVTSFSQCASGTNIYSFNYGSKSYKIVRETKTWTDAASCAVAMGGYLAEINDQSEQDTIFNTIMNSSGISSNYTSVNDGGGIAYVWIGGSDQNAESIWIWDGNGDNVGTNFWTGQGAAGMNNGTVVSGLYNNWGGSSTGTPNEPDDYLSNQDGAAIGLAGWPSFSPGMLGITGEWNDINSTNQLYFVVEFDCISSQSTDVQTACDPYTWIDGNTYTTSNNTATHILTSVLGCDSVVTLDLTITTIDTSIILFGSTITSNQIGASYQWLDCNNGNSIINGETANVFTATQSGNYAVEVTQNGCVDTSFCNSIIITGIEGDESLVQSIYPNPTDGQVNINLGKNNEVIEMLVFDISGRIIYRKEIAFNEVIITADLPEESGVYFIQLKSNLKTATYKISKK